MNGVLKFFVVAGLVLACAAGVQAVDIETVSVGNPGNTPDTRYDTPGYGGVDYVYNIGTFEVTAGQYTEFLNAVADDDTYGLYNTSMWSNSKGCKIERTGAPPNYSYSVGAEWANRPVNFVSWGDAVRFANWLNNGQPTGGQDLSTTEDGSYYLDGASSNAALVAIVREPDATWVIPSEDEWYKAAYHYNDGVTGNYYDYPTSTDAVPNNGNPEGDTGNSANLNDGDYTIGSPYWRTQMGFFGLSESPYDTFDQGGNVWEWNEAAIWPYRGLRGSSFIHHGGSSLHAADRIRYYPTREYRHFGFRVAEVPGQGVTTANLADFATFQRCFGPEPDASCRIAFDFNGADEDIDLDDYAAFFARFTSQSAPP